MDYAETKVYYDGSHFIAIPHTERQTKPRTERDESPISILEEEVIETNDVEVTNESEVTETEVDTCDEVKEKDVQTRPVEKQITRKELFEIFYKDSISLTKRERKGYIIDNMRPFFCSVEDCVKYVDENLLRKLRNLICKRIRMTRKANLQDWTYFCTFTYDDKLHSEDSFKKSLTTTFRLLHHRKGWKYMGVWERSPENKRLHFHGLFYVPEGTMPGIMATREDYSTTAHKMQITQFNDYFERRFGRNDFENLDERLLGNSLSYLMKYLEKTDEKIVYSKGLPQYFISDIMEEDIICEMINPDYDIKKLVLFDNFTCWDQGCLVGKVSAETIAQMRHVN